MLSMVGATALLLSASTLQAAESHTFAVSQGGFQLDGKPFRIVSGEIHYARVPRAYWRTRLRMAKAMGLNAITTYVFWNIHEPSPGVYDFSGDADVAEFIREAQQEGLYVILRPGPYACAEWEFGGFPAWLLKDHSMVVRSSDPKFLAASRAWLLRLGKELAPLQIGNGGPIIMVQVENEYGSYGSDHGYMEAIHHDLVDAGFTKAQFYTADGPEQVPNGSLPELPAAINFGPGDAQKGFATFRKLRPGGPFMVGEYWDGWFDHWGAPHASTDAKQQADELDWVLKQGYSISIYMFHGGTSFGWMNGANSNGKNYEPDVTSYDYDAALDESGHPTPKYYLFRDVIAKDTGITPPPVPAAPPVIAVPSFTLLQSASLWQTLPAPVHSADPLSMEDLDQAYGYILYRTRIAAPVSGELALDTLHDYAQVYVNGKLAGTIDRRLDQKTLPLQITSADAQLDILVENTGRVNYGHALPGERTGILGGVTLAGRPVTGWDIYPLPMRTPGKLPYTEKPCAGACFYRATFAVTKPGDTFLDTSALGKGEVWLNGRPLGRFWDIGPQKALYVPKSWLHEGLNEVIVFDLNGEPGRNLQGLDYSVLNAAVKKGS
ncbi:beta-galactosidase [Acidipila sp. 4G-K13]|uniref:Beta-galactosidase n=2 Tax=Paracidobacterium acidisoli TaxID=2303751 RepID=A0A372INN2_9BACT|nr:beta-galactosidase [Paracidobacterium acidisoli]